MKIEFVSTIAMITPDPPRSRQLYVDTLGLPLAGQSDDGWGQTIVRLLSPEGAIVGISYVPAMHE
jgi:catechol 2,3-dioxygenase-like lactoylglutathione lyase family enzyme